MYIWAGLLSAVAARFFLGLVGKSGTRGVIVLVAPAVEETAKTGAALLLNADIFLTHVVFGGVELAADSRRGRGVWPGLAALALHSVLGFIAAWLYQARESLPLALLPAAALHALWNHAAVVLLGPGRRVVK